MKNYGANYAKLVRSKKTKIMITVHTVELSAQCTDIPCCITTEIMLPGLQIAVTVYPVQLLAGKTRIRLGRHCCVWQAWPTACAFAGMNIHKMLAATAPNTKYSPSFPLRICVATAQLGTFSFSEMFHANFATLLKMEEIGMSVSCSILAIPH
jgi:hypothetical protein